MPSSQRSDRRKSFKYVDGYGRFVAVFTERRFSDDSCAAVWESFDGLTFRRADDGPVGAHPLRGRPAARRSGGPGRYPRLGTPARLYEQLCRTRDPIKPG